MVATEVRAGVATFMVMAYIVFVNPIILGFVGVPGLDGQGLPFAPTLTVTCLTAGLLSIAMGLASNDPFALAPGMGLNAVVAFELVAGRGLTWPQAMTVALVEGVVILLLVLTRFRQAMMDAVPISLKRAISVGIVLNGVFAGWRGFTTPGAARIPATLFQAPDVSTFGHIDFGFFAKLGAVAAVLVVFSVMLSDSFDTMGPRLPGRDHRQRSGDRHARAGDPSIPGQDGAGLRDPRRRRASRRRAGHHEGRRDDPEVRERVRPRVAGVAC